MNRFYRSQGELEHVSKNVFVNYLRGVCSSGHTTSGALGYVVCLSRASILTRL